MLPPPAGCRGAEGCHRGGAAPRLLPVCCSLPGVLWGAVPPPAGTERHQGKERYPLPWITSVSRDMMRTLTKCRRGAHVDDSLQHRAPSSILALRSPVTLLQGPGAKPELHGDRGDSGRHPGVLLVTGAGTEKMGPQALSVNQAGCVYQSLRLFVPVNAEKLISKRESSRVKKREWGDSGGQNGIFKLELKSQLLQKQRNNKYLMPPKVQAGRARAGPHRAGDRQHQQGTARPCREQLARKRHFAATKDDLRANNISPVEFNCY